MKYNIILACTELGLSYKGTSKGPLSLINNINKDNINNIITLDNSNNTNKNNINEIINFNTKLYNEVYTSLSSNYTPIIIGGDHSLSVGSVLACNDYYNDIGVIWIDAHTDFNTFETTVTGNIHGLPLASISGYETNHLCNNVKNTVNPKKIVVVGARSVDKKEMLNIKDSNITVFTTNDIKKEGITSIMDKAFKIAGDKIHISFDTDIIDPSVAPGVSVPEENGINKDENKEIIKYLINKKNTIKSIDFVEYNPSKDINNITKNLLIKTINRIVN